MVFTHYSYTLFETLGVILVPPCYQISFFVVLAALIVESVSHLMTDYHSNGTIVEGIVSIHIEEWRLQDTSRETNLVGGRVVISIHRLGSHEPFILIYRLVQLGLYHILNLPFVDSKHVAEVAVANLQFAVILPLIGIAYLYIECIQLLACHFLCLVAHPILNINTFTQGNLQVAHQFFHTLLGCRWKILCNIKLPQSFAQTAFYTGNSTFPAWTVFCLTAHNCAVECKINIA